MFKQGTSVLFTNQKSRRKKKNIFCLLYLGVTLKPVEFLFIQKENWKLSKIRKQQLGISIAHLNLFSQLWIFRERKMILRTLCSVFCVCCYVRLLFLLFLIFLKRCTSINCEANNTYCVIERWAVVKTLLCFTVYSEIKVEKIQMADIICLGWFFTSWIDITDMQYWKPIFKGSLEQSLPTGIVP